MDKPCSFLNNRLAILNDRITSDLERQGWSVQPDYLPEYMFEACASRLMTLEHNDDLNPAGIGREDQNQLRPDIRRDKIYWLKRAETADAAYLELMESLRLTLNENLFLGVFEYEAHYASYPPGGFYKKHVDAFKGQRNRVVSTVCYLNDTWHDEDGGILVLYDGTGAEIVHQVTPHGGTLVVFMSEDIPHEVTPAIDKYRRSIAGWFRVNNSIQNRIDPLR